MIKKDFSNKIFNIVIDINNFKEIWKKTLIFLLPNQLGGHLFDIAKTVQLFKSYQAIKI